MEDTEDTITRLHQELLYVALTFNRRTWSIIILCMLVIEEIVKAHPDVDPRLYPAWLREVADAHDPDLKSDYAVPIHLQEGGADLPVRQAFFVAFIRSWRRARARGAAARTFH